MRSLILVRRIDQGGAVEAAGRLALGVSELAMRAGAGGCFLLEDVGGDPSEGPAGLAVFDLDWPARRAMLRRLEVAAGYPSEKLVSGAVMLLRAEGFESIET
jgi:hypothetical protein